MRKAPIINGEAVLGGLVIAAAVFSVVLLLVGSECSEIDGEAYEHLGSWSDSDLAPEIKEAYSDGKISKWEYNQLCSKMNKHNQEFEKKKAMEKFK
jgi:hypothetical protein